MIAVKTVEAEVADGFGGGILTSLGRERVGRLRKNRLSGGGRVGL